MAGDMAQAITDDIRRRDEARLAVQATEGLAAGRDMLHHEPVKPEPLVKPKREAAVPANDDDDRILPEPALVAVQGKGE